MRTGKPSEQAIKGAREKLEKYLADNSMRKTPERFAILEQIYSIRGHFDVEKLYSIMHKNNYNVSLATMYNTVELFAKCNLIVKHQFGDVAQYEKVDKEKKHHHLVCTACWSIKEFSAPNIELGLQSKKMNNFNVSHYSVSVYGTCRSCKRKATSL